MTIVTIGHSHIPTTRVIELLKRHHRDMIIDVRSQPQSRFAPRSNRQALHPSLAQGGLT